ncbi:MAG: GHKL domain-containing protein [Clostridiales bacterium]|nr:GHKL domain-containing protein [Clostridiales bacterium]
MRKTVYRVLAVAVSLVLCVVFAAALLVYARPMKDAVYDLSMACSGEAIPSDWVFDSKGWTVFAQEGETVTELHPNGFGGFTGLPVPGQTFYFSRIMTEELDSPTLRLDAANRNVAVFLDGKLLYTDCPELDNRIGYLTLPMLEWDRTEQVTVTLPADYAGCTLTIAQSTDLIGEKQEPDTTVWPCAVTLYCGYAYESSLIAESFQTAVPASFLFLAGVFLLAVFVGQAFRGKADVGLVCAAIMAFLWLTSRMYMTSFALFYFVQLPVDIALQCREFALTALLAFLSSRMTGRRRVILAVLAGAQGAAALVYLILQLAGSLSFGFLSVMYAIGLGALLAALVCGFWERRKGSWFFSLFCPLTAAGIVLLGIAVCVLPAWRSQAWQQITLGSFPFFLWPLMLLMLAAALAVAVMEAVRRELARRTEADLMAQRQELAYASYETMRRQHEQVMMLRHDMAKHFRLLRQMTGETAVAGYLDELIGQNEKIRPVVQSGNQMLDIILNGKLTAAEDAGIKVEIVRMQAPEKLPLSDAELCSLLVNLMDNAVAAASEPGVEQPYIRLDAHLKNDFFVFSCKNSATWEWMQERKSQEAVPKHSLGLKIIRQISQHYGDLMETERGPDYYKVMLAIPMDQPSK